MSQANHASSIGKIYDVDGQGITILASGRYPAGWFKATWDGSDEYGNAVSPGVYFYNLEANNFTGAQKMVLLK